MVLQYKAIGESEASCESYWIKTLESRMDAKRITDFLLSENSFDDRNFTKGEIIQLKSLPIESLKGSNLKFWYAENRDKEIIGIISLRENEQISGGYFIDYLAVHKQNRHMGIAHQFLDIVINRSQMLNGRYIHVNTCDTILYESARKLFESKGFSVVGHLPDYYFKGEGMILYYRKV